MSWLSELFNSAPPPPAPDPNVTAQKTADINKQTAIQQFGLNATNQQTPYGNLAYSQIGTWADGTPRYEATQTLSPEQQQLYQTYTGAQQSLGQAAQDQAGRVQGTLGTPFDYNSAINNQQARIWGDLYDPIWQRRQEQQETQLRNQGFQPGTEGWSNSLRDFGMQRNDAYNQALLASRGQAGTEAMAQRNQPLNELTALLSQSQVQSPNFVNTPQTQVAGTNYGQIANDAFGNQMAGYAAQQAKQGALFGALGSIGGTALGGWGKSGLKSPWG